MKSPRILLVLGLILVVAGVWGWKFFGTKKAETAPPAKAATLASTAIKPMVLKSALAVEAPQAAPAAVDTSAPPAPFLDADQARLEGFRREAVELAPKMKEMMDRNIANAPDDAARARLEEFEKNELASLEKQKNLPDRPPDDIGEIDINALPQVPQTKGANFSAPNAPKYALSGGETITLALVGNMLLLTELDVPTPQGPTTAKRFLWATAGAPMIQLLQDGTSVKFTLVGGVTDPALNNN